MKEGTVITVSIVAFLIVMAFMSYFESQVKKEELRLKYQHRNCLIQTNENKTNR